MRVLHIDRIFSGEAGLPEMDTNRPTATLEVTPEQAELLTVAVSEGQLILLLRGEDPGEETRTADYTTDFETSRALVDLLYGLTLPDPPAGFAASVGLEAPEESADTTDDTDFLELQDYLSDLGDSSGTGNVGTGDGSDGESVTGRSEGEVRVYRSTAPQDLDFSQ